MDESLDPDLPFPDGRLRLLGATMSEDLEARMEMARAAALEVMEEAACLRALSSESVQTLRRQVQEHMEQRFVVRETVARSEARRRTRLALQLDPNAL